MHRLRHVPLIRRSPSKTRRNRGSRRSGLASREVHRSIPDPRISLRGPRHPCPSGRPALRSENSPIALPGFPMELSRIACPDGRFAGPTNAKLPVHRRNASFSAAPACDLRDVSALHEPITMSLFLHRLSRATLVRSGNDSAPSLRYGADPRIGRLRPSTAFHGPL